MKKALSAPVLSPWGGTEEGALAIFQTQRAVLLSPKEESWLLPPKIRWRGAPTTPEVPVCLLGGFWDVGKRVPSLY